MKRILLVLMACFPVIGLMAAEVEPLAGDTPLRENVSR